MNAARLGDESCSAPDRRLDTTREAGDLLLAIACALNPLVAGVVCSTGSRGRVCDGERHFLDAGQHLVHALVEGAGQHGVGHDHIEPLEVRHSRQQIPVGWKQAKRIEGGIAHRQHDVPVRARTPASWRSRSRRSCSSDPCSAI